jgi:hypothetical protein
MRPLLPLLLTPFFALLSCEDGPYGAPPGQFFCGSTTCEISTQYCVIAPAPDGGANVATCGVATAACPNGTPDCACVAYQCAGTCQAGSDGSVTLTCTK